MSETKKTAEMQDPAADAQEENGFSVEESFAVLDEMVKRLESEDVTLEESFQLYQDGMKLLKKVSEKIETYEKKMQILSGDGEIGEFE